MRSAVATSAPAFEREQAGQQVARVHLEIDVDEPRRTGPGGPDPSITVPPRPTFSLDARARGIAGRGGPRTIPAYDVAGAVPAAIVHEDHFDGPPQASRTPNTSAMLAARIGSSL